jgi:hypothetical protein
MTTTVIPLVYGLLIGKYTQDYNAFFEKVFEQDDFHPESILTDYESATIKSVKALLPNILHKGNSSSDGLSHVLIGLSL